MRRNNCHFHLPNNGERTENDTYTPIKQKCGDCIQSKKQDSDTSYLWERELVVVEGVLNA